MASAASTKSVPATAASKPPYVFVHKITTKGPCPKATTVINGLADVPGWDPVKDSKRLMAVLDKTYKCRCIGGTYLISFPGDHANEPLLELLAANGLKREWTELAWFL